MIDSLRTRVDNLEQEVAAGVVLREAITKELLRLVLSDPRPPLVHDAAQNMRAAVLTYDAARARINPVMAFVGSPNAR